MLQSLIIGIASGIFSSVLFWIVLNVWFTARIQTDDQIQHSKRKKYIRVYNKSLFSVYEVTCYIEYKFNDGTSFFRKDNALPYLEKRRGKYNVVLNGNSGKLIRNTTKSGQNSSKTEKGTSTEYKMPVEKFFSQSKGTIILTITYQNRFGVKRTIAPVVLDYNSEPSTEEA